MAQKVKKKGYFHSNRKRTSTDIRAENSANLCIIEGSRWKVQRFAHRMSQYFGLELEVRPLLLSVISCNPSGVFLNSSHGLHKAAGHQVSGNIQARSMVYTVVITWSLMSSTAPEGRFLKSSPENGQPYQVWSDLAVGFVQYQHCWPFFR